MQPRHKSPRHLPTSRRVVRVARTYEAPSNRIHWIEFVLIAAIVVAFASALHIATGA